jgi:hypothetical protein
VAESIRQETPVKQLNEDVSREYPLGAPGATPHSVAASDSTGVMRQADLESEARTIAAYRERVRAITLDVHEIRRNELEHWVEFWPAPGAGEPDSTRARHGRKVG